MATLTLNMTVAGRRAVLVGGGSVAARKARLLSEAGMALTVVAAVRDEVAQVLDEAYGEALELLAELREKLLTLGAGHTYNTRLIKELLAAGLVDLVRQGNRAAAEDLIRRCCVLPAGEQVRNH